MTDSPTPVDPQMAEALDWLMLEDDMDAATRRRFDAWLAASEGNARAYRRARDAWQSPLLTTAAARLEQRVAAPARRRSRWKPLATAAMLVLAVGAAWQDDLLLRLRADHLTAVGERQNLDLADGSRILLNTDTALSSHIDEQQRIARLYRGEAYFDVAHDRSRPFEVEAGPVQVTVRGTAFAVKYLGNEAEVSVQRGEVDLRTPLDNARISLTAGDSIRVGPQGFGERQHSVEDQAQLAWVKGRLVFENCPLSQVLAELRRYYPGWIVNTNERLDNVSVTGNWRLDDPLGVARSLARIASAQLHEYPKLLVLN
ncbi:FecR domain-containing protein [Pseudomonas sp. LA21]|uniref:FecR family protein n=1 Tax=unclassified Pseudomonas TaxID=196821 RepID=UPI001FB6690A|nr:FecR domain-containing protein [Pseudomonas sp. LA21]MCJ1885918.1 FecR domain-containing protein [Pseudomonas sp. LA21]